MGKRKGPSGPSGDNQNADFCDFLLELAEFEKNVSRNVHKYNVYRKAASVLASHPTRIGSGKEAKSLPGIGEKISQKIDEFLQTGKLRKLENIHNDTNSTAINLLTRVTGIGPAKAQTLVNEGITTLEQLKEHPEKLNHHQIVGLKYFTDFELKIPRKEVEEIEKILKAELEKFDPLIELTVCGSYRRGKAESGDIDVLLTHPNHTSDTVSQKNHKKKSKNESLLKDMVKTLEKCCLITETLSLGDSKFMGACKLSGDDAITRRLDLRLTPYDQYFCAILHFTGSDLFNKEMRAHALEAGFTLNEYTLRPVGSTGVPGEPLQVHSEEEIFDFIGFPFKEPHDRCK